MGLNKKIVNNADELIIARRRELVARARLRGATQREIVEILPKIGEADGGPCVNEATSEPWSLGTINSDIKALQSEWKREAKKAVDHHKARELAELQEAKRQAFHDNDIASVLRAVALEMSLLGTEEPKRQANVNFDLDVSDLPDDVIDKLARGEKVDLASIASQSRARKT